MQQIHSTCDGRSLLRKNERWHKCPIYPNRGLRQKEAASIASDGSLHKCQRHHGSQKLRLGSQCLLVCRLIEWTSKTAIGVQPPPSETKKGSSTFQC